MTSRFRVPLRLRVPLVVCAVAVGLAVSTGSAQAAWFGHGGLGDPVWWSSPFAAGVDVAQDRLTPTSMTAGVGSSASLTVHSSSCFTAKALGVGVRDVKGRNLDFPGNAAGVRICPGAGVTFTSGSRDLPAGDYTVFGFWQDYRGGWHNLPEVPLTVSAASAGAPSAAAGAGPTEAAPTWQSPMQQPSGGSFPGWSREPQPSGPAPTWQFPAAQPSSPRSSAAQSPQAPSGQPATSSPVPDPVPSAAAPSGSAAGAVVPGKGVVFDAPFSDAGQWTVGRTSAFPGSSPQTNPGDHKSDRIGPALSAPDADGTFKAVRNGQYWDADLVTTEYAPGNFQAQVGDSLTARVTLDARTGAWPAIWTWSTGALQDLPGHGEVDLFEYHGENASLLELSNHVQESHEFADRAITPGVPFDLRVDFDRDGVKYYVNGVLKTTLSGLPANWRSNLIVNMSVASGDNPYHQEPGPSTGEVGFKVEGLKVWR